MAITLGQRNLSIPQHGLVLLLDANNTASYPGSGSVWYDISGGGNNFNINSSAFTTASGISYMNFGGSYGCAKSASGKDFMPTGTLGNEVTYVCWTRILNSTTDWRTLTRSYSSGSDHHVIIQSGTYNIGMFDNVNGTGFNNSGYLQSSIPGYNTGAWNMLVWRFAGYSPNYQLTINNSTTVVGSISSIYASYKYGICSIGAYNSGDQSNVNIGAQYWGDIGQFAVYNRQLTNAEILQAYAAGVPKYAGGTQLYENTLSINGVVQANTASNYGNSVSITTFTSAGTYTVPSNCTRVQVQLVGGGGGSAGYCESGGGGGFAEGIFTVTPGASIAVTVGGGGAGVGYYGIASSGGTTSFGSYISATGGQGANGTVAHAGGHGGLGSGGQTYVYGGNGTGHANAGSHNNDGTGGNSFFGSGPAGSRHNPSGANNFSGAVGSGAAGNESTDGTQGSTGIGGLVIVYAYQ